MNHADQLSFYRTLLSELRIIPVTVTDRALSERALVRAITANDEIAALGWTLAPADVVLLSRCEELDEFPSLVRDLTGDVKAAPMYPDFPNQVMEMSVAKFRFHQMLHYLSTYGMEAVTGEPVLRGWLPDEKATEKTKELDHLLSARVVQLVDKENAAFSAFSKILSKNERMTDNEAELIQFCLPMLTFEQLSAVKVRFKENLTELFGALVEGEGLTAEQRRSGIRAICQHTGDVWKCIDSYLCICRWHFRTSEKRLFVKVLESYPVTDFRTNLMLSNIRRERILLLLKYIDYNTYSRSAEHKEAVRKLRAGELHSWQSDFIRRVRDHAPDTLAFAAKRPGMMLRMITLLLRNGFSKEDIAAHLAEQAAALRTQTIVTMLNFFDKDPEPMAAFEIADEHIRTWEHYIKLDGSVLLPRSVAGGESCTVTSIEMLHNIIEDRRRETMHAQRRNEEYPVLTEICKAVLEANLAAKNIPVRGKKVAFRTGEFAPEYSLILTNDKSDEGGYIPSGVAYRIPEGVDRIRFFVYWNDKRRVDVDLHTLIHTTDGKQIAGGWNTNFRSDCMAFSGDITHSDAAEYIDIDLSKGLVDRATATVHVYCIDYPRDEKCGKGYLSEVETCFVGCMAVKELKEDVKLYSPSNCFFTHDLKSKCTTLQYGYVDAKNRCVVFIGQPVAPNDWNSDALPPRTNFSMKAYFDILCKAADLTVVPEEEAEVVFVLGKPSAENEISLRDCNYYMDSADSDKE